MVEAKRAFAIACAVIHRWVPVVHSASAATASFSFFFAAVKPAKVARTQSISIRRLSRDGVCSPFSSFFSSSFSSSSPSFSSPSFGSSMRSPLELFSLVAGGDGAHGAFTSTLGPSVAPVCDKVYFPSFDPCGRSSLESSILTEGGDGARGPCSSTPGSTVALVCDMLTI